MKSVAESLDGRIQRIAHERSDTLARQGEVSPPSRLKTQADINALGAVALRSSRTRSVARSGRSAMGTFGADVKYGSPGSTTVLRPLAAALSAESSACCRPSASVSSET